jgi:site-specific recombinase XerC
MKKECFINKIRRKYMISLNQLKKINALRDLRNTIVSKKIRDKKLQEKIMIYTKKIGEENCLKYHRLRNHLLSASLKTRNEIRLLQAKLELELLSEPWVYTDANIYNYLTSLK